MLDRLVEAYMGDKYNDVCFPEKPYHTKSAIWGLFFGPILFFYYRSYLVGFGFLLLTSIVNNILSSIVSNGNSYTSVMWAIIYGYITNIVYKWDVERKMKKLLDKNSDLSESELLDIAEKKGRNNPLAMTIYIILYILYIIIAILAIITKANV